MPSDSNVSPPEPDVLPRPVGCTNFKLRQLTRRVTQHYDRHLAHSGLKTTQYSLLSHVDRLGPLPPGELARRMDMDASTLSRNLRPLLVAEWVHMGEGVDGRSRVLTITDAGRDLRRQAQRHWKAAQVALNQMLGPATVVALHDLLDQGLATFHTFDET
ncbi:MarR family winged helix-turn-helix transcriptional regulator [Hydrogenophaga sp.]|uniref:MarR family winged helix-turn-helix transcriptional regulator n=1 Tax=Hydrogenophaga sp. TaxID=1904254 RepID=UPI00271688F9|nr:MarR family winged helix-turn-helix transcriptional regulator [Hydrogenophaga sp.]MDO8903479.1 MarR family winged helix-turn-helix transcriptional regulator [Hydrogenophaga sp.]